MRSRRGSGRWASAPPPRTASSPALATIAEDTDTPNATEMVRRLEKDQEAVVRVVREVFPVAEAAQDQSTVDLLTRRMQIHEKTAWMLRSVLE